MTLNMTPAVRDELAELAFGLARGLSKTEAKEALAGMFSTQHDLTPDDAWALYVRGRDLARKRGELV